jgi:DNA-binding NtrC family response regulator
MDLKSIVAQYLREAADKIENGSCSLNDTEIKYLVSHIMHEEMNKQEAADYLNMSTRTFDRYIEKGELSQSVHVRGSKNLIWYKDELVK